MAIHDSSNTATAIEVEIVYALLSRQVLKKIQVPAGTTLEQAIHLSGIMKQFPEIDLGKNRIGVFGRLAERDALVKSRDRVEIYRPLLIDPKEARKLRVSGNKIRK